MLQRMTSLLARTLREDPADAEAPSHRLLVRAGYVRRAAAGIPTWLPLGLRVLSRVEAVVREELAAIGAQEVRFPALLPAEPYERTGRLEKYGDLLFRLTDRRDGQYVLGPTHEEMFSLLAKGEVASYRDLPLILFQIQTKYRDEARPRSGLLRGREFVMKDSYSFDLSPSGLAESYALHRAAYQRIFDRLGLEYAIVRADSGAMGGTDSEEFLAPTEVGEDTFVVCKGCGYAANTEVADVSPAAPLPAPDARPAAVDTPGAKTVEQVAALLGVEPAGVLKTLLVTVDGRLVALGVPGDREVDLARVEVYAAPAVVALAGPEDLVGRSDLTPGYLGPYQRPADVEFWADRSVAPGAGWVVGGNAVDVHVRDAVLGRDFEADRTLRLAAVRDGDPCPECGGPLSVDRAVEVGHIFALGSAYSDVFELDVPTAEGTLARLVMGSYGIGVSRLLAAIAEQHHDEAGLRWPAAVAPYDVQVVPLGRGDQPALALALAEELAAAGRDVLLDDRDGLSAGVRFADAELIGVPYTVVVGRRAAEGYVELRDRRTGEKSEVALADVLAAVSSPSPS